jgi:adenylosuccinate synthase
MNRHAPAEMNIAHSQFNTTEGKLIMISQAIAVIDCGYGDAGKGTMIDAFSRRTKASLVVRANGGQQARHTVVTDDGRIHGFSQFGSASFVEGTETFLSRFMIVSPTHLIEEAEHLESLGVARPFDRLIIDYRSPIVTLYHRAANWLKELARGEDGHGTCGMGIGELMQDLLNQEEDVIFAKDLQDMRTLVVKTRRLRNRKRAEVEDLLQELSGNLSQRVRDALRVLDENSAMAHFLDNCKHVAERARIIDERSVQGLFARSGTILFEGAQGVLLDEDYGFHPHTTWSHTTSQNVDTLLEENRFEGTREYIGVLRTYATRHGAGPFVTDTPEMKSDFPEPHNVDDCWQGNFRVGPFDLVASRYAVRVAGGLSGLAMTHVDRLPALIRVCTEYRYNGSSDIDGFFETREAPGFGTVITDIRVSNAKGDLAYQSALTEHLKQCSPIYEEISASRFLIRIEEELRLPILATSHGPATSQKAFFPSLSAVRAA